MESELDNLIDSVKWPSKIERYVISVNNQSAQELIDDVDVEGDYDISM